MQRCSIQSAAEIKESGNGCGQALPGLGSLCDMGLQKPTAWPRGAPARQTETAVLGGPDLAFLLQNPSQQNPQGVFAL